MGESNYILGLFYSDENGVVFDNIKLSEDLTENRKVEIRMLPFKFLGPVFMTGSSSSEAKWKIELIEATLSISDVSSDNVNILQSFFNLNSSLDSGGGTTNLSALIGSPYTEDIKVIYDNMINYIHPSIIQGKLVNEGYQGKNFQYLPFIHDELDRGLELIEYKLGSARRVYWEEQQNFQCIALIEREIINGNKTSSLYTFNKDNSLRKIILSFIPSFYVMSILPDYYENLINITLEMFSKKEVAPHLRLIKLRYENKTVHYMEEFLTTTNKRKKLGVILIPDERGRESTNISHFRKMLRSILDSNKNLEDSLLDFNENFSTIKWGINSDEDLNNIHQILDRSV